MINVNIEVLRGINKYFKLVIKNLKKIAHNDGQFCSRY